MRISIRMSAIAVIGCISLKIRWVFLNSTSTLSSFDSSNRSSFDVWFQDWMKKSEISSRCTYQRATVVSFFSKRLRKILQWNFVNVRSSSVRAKSPSVTWKISNNGENREDLLELSVTDRCKSDAFHPRDRAIDDFPILTQDLMIFRIHHHSSGKLYEKRSSRRSFPERQVKSTAFSAQTRRSTARQNLYT